MKRLLLIVYFTVIACQLEAFLCVNESAIAYSVYALGVYADPYIDRGVNFICSCFDFLSDLFTFPFVPIGNMREGFFSSVKCNKLAVFVKLVFCSTGFAGKMYTPTPCSTFASAYRTFIEQSLKSVCSEAFAYFDIVFLLPFE